MKFALTLAAFAALTLTAVAGNCSGQHATYAAGCSGGHASYGAGCSGGHAYATPVRSFLHHVAAHHAAGCSGSHASYAAGCSGSHASYTAAPKIVVVIAPESVQAAKARLATGAKAVQIPAVVKAAPQAAPAPVPAAPCPNGVCPKPAARMPIDNGPVRALVQTVEPPLARLVGGAHERLVHAGARAHEAANRLVDAVAAGTHRLLHFLRHPLGHFRRN